MRISKKAEYALRTLVVMAGNRRSWTVSELSRTEGIPAKILEQVLLALKRGGLLMSMRGMKGGYTFRRDPSDVTVRDIIVVIDGPIAPVACAAGPIAGACSCPDPRNCSVQRVMREAKERLEEVLQSYTLADLAASIPGKDLLSFEI